MQGYVRRSGTEMGVYATQTNKGDIQVALRPAGDDPVSLLTKPVRPPLDDIKKELEKQGKELDAKQIEIIRKKYRRRTTDDVMKEIDDAIGDRFSDHQLQHEQVQIMQDELSDLSGASKPIEVRLYGADQAVLRQLAQQVADRLGDDKRTGGALTGVETTVTGTNADLPIVVDELAAERVGLTPEAVRRQMAVMFAGQIAAEAPESSVRITDVRVRYPDELRFGPLRPVPGEEQRQRWFNPSLSLRQWVLLPEGKAPPPGVPQGPGRGVPLSEVAHVTPMRTPMEQWRQNQQPAAFVTAELDPHADLGTVAKDMPRWLSDVHFPPDYRWELGGHVLQQQSAFQSLAAVMLTAVLLVYLMLAFQFRSVVLPLVIFMTQPLSIVSGLFALWLTNTPLNISSYMGAILLIGLDMKNGILLVEYIQKLRAEGMALKPALMLAGHTRFRPILMTSLAAILGLLPLAMGIGPGAQMQQPLAVMVIGGLTANMLFTRAVIPAGYEVVEWLFGRSAEEAGAAREGPCRPGPCCPGAGRRGGRNGSRGGRDGRPAATSGGSRRRLAGISRANQRSEEMTPRSRTPLLAALAALLAAAAAPAADAPRELVQTIVSQGKAGDLDHLALDVKGQRLFLSNKANDTLDVLDLKAGQLLKQIPGQNGVQGVAYAPDLDRVFDALARQARRALLLTPRQHGQNYRVVKTIKFAC